MSSAFPKINAPTATLHHLGCAKLAGLCHALRQDSNQTGRAIEVFQVMTQHWCGAAEAKSGWQSDITDDGTPFEFSASFHAGGVDLRMLVEPQTASCTLATNWDAGLALNELLEQKFGANLDNFRKIQSLFAPARESTARFAIWHAAALAPDASRLFKVYLNPLTRGDNVASQVVQEALYRLDRHDALDRLAPVMADPASQPRYFSVDLIESGTARVKIYFARSGHVDSIDRDANNVARMQSGEASLWIQRLTDRREDFSQRPILTCYAFDTEGAAPSATIHVPVRCYLSNDAEAADRVCSFLSPSQATDFRRLLSALSPRPLERNSGLITYASLRKARGQLRVTVYLAPQVYAFA
jgi:DMATS type aromatic prenyltransferase